MFYVIQLSDTYIGLLESTTHLRPRHYQNLFVNMSSKMLPHRPTYTYHADKQIWSIIPAFPTNSYDKLSDHLWYVSFFIYYTENDKIIWNSQPDIVHITGQEWNAMLFSHIVKNTRNVAIGPLEYCGNGRIVQMAKGVQA